MMRTTKGAKGYSYMSKFATFLGNEIVSVPDQIAEEQHYHDRAQTAFRARRRIGRTIIVRLDGEAYGLWTPGTGDMRVQSA